MKSLLWFMTKAYFHLYKELAGFLLNEVEEVFLQTTNYDPEYLDMHKN